MSLRWEGLDLQPAHRRWRFWVAEGRDELPEVRSSSELIPFRRGRLHQAGIADKRVLEVRGYIQEATEAALRAQHDTLKGLLAPERAGPGTLVDDFEDGSQRWIRANPRSIIPRYGGKATRLLSIELEALDPFWYGSFGASPLDAGFLLDDGESLDQGAWIVVTPSSTAHPLDINTLGSAEVQRIRVKLVGPSITPPGLEVVTPEGIVGFTLGSNLLAGQEIELDNDLRTVTLGGVSQRATLALKPANRHGEYVRLLAGVNTVRVLGQPLQFWLLFTPTYL